MSIGKVGRKRFGGRIVARAFSDHLERSFRGREAEPGTHEHRGAGRAHRRLIASAQSRARCGKGRPMSSLLGQTDLFEHALDPDLLLVDERCKLIGRHVGVHPPPLLEIPCQAAVLTIVPMASSSAFLSAGLNSRGAINPRQLTSSTLTPCSLKVGMLIPGSLSGEEIARARSLPDSSCWANSLSPPVATVMCPPMTCASISPPAPATM